MNRRLALMIGGPIALWLLLFIPARAIGGWNTVLHSAAAMGLCTVPAALSLLWLRKVPPEQFLVRVMGGMGLRVAFVLGAGLVLYLTVPEFKRLSFWVWVLVFYLFTLGWEMYLILAGRAFTPSDGVP